MKQILFCVLFCFLFSSSYALADTLKVVFSVKEHHDNAFDYNTINYKFLIIDKNIDSINVIVYVLDNSITPYTTKMQFLRQYSISKESYDVFKNEINSILQIQLEPTIKETPRCLAIDCYGWAPLEIIARITFESTLKGRGYYFFDQNYKGDNERLNSIRKLLHETLKLDR